VNALRAEVEALREAVALKDRSLGMASHARWRRSRR
jgi:hypothetical protein